VNNGDSHFACFGYDSVAVVRPDLNVMPHRTGLFLSFDLFLWFRQATIDQLSAIEPLTHHHLCWPQFDVDLAVQSIRDPSAYPLVSRGIGQPGAAADTPPEGAAPLS